MSTFSDNLADLASAEHLARIELYDATGARVGTIENKPGSQGSLKVYLHLLNAHGGITPRAAEEGLALYAEHTADAQTHPGKHPNIDRMFEVMETGRSLRVEVYPA